MALIIAILFLLQPQPVHDCRSWAYNEPVFRLCVEFGDTRLWSMLDD